MTAAPEIPADVMAAAEAARDSWLAIPRITSLEDVIARAILAERERCAKAAKDSCCGEDSEYGCAFDGACSYIAEKIIQGPTT